MNIFWSPGGSLAPNEKGTFEEIRQTIDTATNDYLIKPDWASNMACVDHIKFLSPCPVLNEVMLYFRRKLSNNNPKVVVLTFRLLESLVTNCDDKFYSCINDRTFLNDIAKTARKYCSKIGPQYREAAETSLDVIQGWGEAFLTKRNRYPNITELYFNLRKEGLPFKKDSQFASSRVPIFNDSFLGLSGDSLDSSSNSNNNNNDTRRNSTGASRPAINAMHNQSPPTIPKQSTQQQQQQRQQQPPPQQRQQQQEVPDSSQTLLPVNELISSLTFFISLLCDMVSSSDDRTPYSDNEVTAEVLQSIRQLQTQMNNAIEETLTNDPEKVADLLSLNEDAQMVLSVHLQLVTRGISVSKAKALLSPISTGKKADNSNNNNNNNTDSEPFDPFGHQQQQQQQQQQHHSGQPPIVDLLDMDNNNNHNNNPVPTSMMRQLSLGSDDMSMSIQPTESGDILYRPRDPFSDKGLDAILGTAKQVQTPKLNPPVPAINNNNNNNNNNQGKRINIKIAPPPTRPNVTQSGKELILPSDPFSDKGLDAIIGNNKVQHTDSGSTLIQPRDPFSNSGLDILLSTKPIAAVNVNVGVTQNYPVNYNTPVANPAVQNYNQNAFFPPPNQFQNVGYNPNQILQQQQPYPSYPYPNNNNNNNNILQPQYNTNNTQFAQFNTNPTPPVISNNNNNNNNNNSITPNPPTVTNQQNNNNNNPFDLY